MSKLINQAFEHIDALSPHVQSGHYDLVDPDGQIILPTLWDATAQPGCAVQQHLWPLPEGETEPKPPPPPPGDGILNLDEVLRPNPKRKKRPAQPPPPPSRRWHSRPGRSLASQPQEKETTCQRYRFLDAGCNETQTDVKEKAVAVAPARVHEPAAPARCGAHC
jgi:hypothetical protein